jgi:hypothetical protein
VVDHLIASDHFFGGLNYLFVRVPDHARAR